MMMYGLMLRGDEGKADVTKVEWVGRSVVESEMVESGVEVVERGGNMM